MIKGFRGEYFFLSNFYETDIHYNGITYKSSESAFQAMKCKRISSRKSFIFLSPSEAKSKGKRISLREDWDEVKDNIMYDICRIKFSKPILKAKLLATGDQYLEETNDWGDDYWGVLSNGKGKNKLGKILMKIREELKLEVMSYEKF